MLKFTFLTYVIYLLLMVAITSKFAGEELDKIELKEQGLITSDEIIGSSFYIMILLMIVAIAIGVSFMRDEVNSMIDNAKLYWADYWNYIDWLSFILNILFIVVVLISCIL
jgi:hypothetical protein